MDPYINYIHCPHCWQKFTNTGLLQEHLSSHTPRLSFLKSRRESKIQPICLQNISDNENSTTENMQQHDDQYSQENFLLTRKHARRILKFINRYQDNKDVQLTKANLAKAVYGGPYELTLVSDTESVETEISDESQESTSSNDSDTTSESDDCDEEVANFLEALCNAIKSKVISIENNLYLTIIENLDINE